MHLLWACAIVSAPVWVGALSHRDCKDVTADDGDEWIEKGGFIILFATIILCFWGMAVVCEEYYVPALKILCLEYSISDAVAGSTFMAAGASSPELFVSLSALFIEDSSVGLGTVVGSEIFNHLIIPAISIFYAKGGCLPLDYRIIVKDILFYFVTLMLLVVAIKKNTGAGYKEAFFDSTWDDCLEVNLGQSFVLIFIYILYALVTIYFSQVCAFLRVPVPLIAAAAGGANMNMSPTKSPRASNVEGVSYVKNPMSSSPRSGNSSMASSTNDATSPRPSTVGTEAAENPGPRIRVQSYTEEMVERLVGLAPIESYEGYVEEDWEDDAGTGTETGVDFDKTQLSMYLYVKNETMASLGLYRRVWGLWYFTLTPHSLSCRRHKADPKRGDHVKVYSLHDAVQCVPTIEKDGSENTFKVSYGDAGVTFKAVTADCKDKMLQMLNTRVKHLSQLPADDKYVLYSKNFQAIKTAPEELETLLEVPVVNGEDGFGHLRLFSYYFTWPLRWMFTYTLWDMRIPSNRKYYLYTVMTSIAWLFVLSLILIECCTGLGLFLGLTDTIIGITVSAIGTSFPNMWSSMVVARQGLGDMAITNSLGSNIFNVCIGLGLPWVLYTGLELKGGSYTGIADDGVTMLIFVLIIVLAMYLILLISSNFVMYKWMSFAFVTGYLMVIVLACIVS